MDPVRSLLDSPAEEDRSAGESESVRVPVRLMRFLRPALVGLGVRGGERGSLTRALQHNPPRWDSNPRSRIQMSAARIHKRPGQPRMTIDHHEHQHDQGTLEKTNSRPTPRSSHTQRTNKTRPALPHCSISSYPSPLDLFLSLPPRVERTALR